MWFSPIKGSYMTLAQIDKTAMVELGDKDAKLVKRGMFLKLNAKGNFEPYPDTDAPGDVPYICLQDYNDYTAGAAGSGSEAFANNDANGTGADGWIKPGDAYGLNNGKFATGPRVTGVSVLMPGEYQTTAFAEATGDIQVGDALVIKGGMLAKAASGTKGNVVGYVTKAPFKRWINDLNADVAGAHCTGGTATVIQWATHFVPTTDAPDAETGADIKQAGSSDDQS